MQPYESNEELFFPGSDIEEEQRQAEDIELDFPEAAVHVGHGHLLDDPRYRVVAYDGHGRCVHTGCGEHGHACDHGGGEDVNPPAPGNAGGYESLQANLTQAEITYVQQQEHISFGHEAG